MAKSRFTVGSNQYRQQLVSSPGHQQCVGTAISGMRCLNMVSTDNPWCGRCIAPSETQKKQILPSVTETSIDLPFMMSEHPEFEWDTYTDDQKRNLARWLVNERGNDSLVEEVAQEPWGRLRIVLRTGSHVPPQSAMAARIVSQTERNHKAVEFAKAILDRYSVREQGSGAERVVLISRGGSRAIKLREERYKDSNGVSRTAHIGIYNTALAIIEDDPEQSWDEYRLAAVFKALGANRHIANPHRRAREILRELKERGCIKEEDGGYKGLGADRTAVLRSDRLLPEAVGGIFAMHAEDNDRKDRDGNICISTRQVAEELYLGGFVQESDDIDAYSIQKATIALTRLYKERGAVRPSSTEPGMWVMSPAQADHMPIITLETV